MNPMKDAPKEHILLFGKHKQTGIENVFSGVEKGENYVCIIDGYNFSEKYDILGWDYLPKKNSPSLEEKVLELDKQLYIAKTHIKHIFEILKEMNL